MIREYKLLLAVSNFLSHSMESNQQNKNSREVLESSIENVNVANIVWVDTILFRLETKW